MKNKIQPRLHTTIDIKYFNERIEIDKDCTPENARSQYTYRLIHNGSHYFLRGFKLPLTFSDTNKQCITLYEAYYLMKSLSQFTPHIAKPLLLNSSNDYKSARLYIEVLFKVAKVDLEELKFTYVTQFYEIIRQSANVIALLHLSLIHISEPTRPY
eukprot:TRINITY_DN16515_c0_g1_i2.p1 TRINITY_DN16515_c0_g1~~TRINITY_DN16515_c0_g1_i2.p1  ORF type:complete len:181 (-),score=22.62 TRINITY_DN16515_c0_g1_i2:24-491(-)